jgi:hypothetical protein
VGLGLSLVEAVARLHSSSLLFEDNWPGLRASMVLQLDTSGTAQAVLTPSSGAALRPAYPDRPVAG